MKESLDFFTIHNNRFSNEWRIIIQPSKDIVCGFHLSQADFELFYIAGPGTPSGHSQASAVVWFALVGEKKYILNHFVLLSLMRRKISIRNLFHVTGAPKL